MTLVVIGAVVLMAVAFMVLVVLAAESLSGRHLVDSMRSFDEDGPSLVHRLSA